MTLSQYNISHRTCKVNVQNYEILRRITIVIEITKDTASFIREKLPNVCIVKTLKTKGGSKGTYFIEETNTVLKLISQYKKSEKIIEEYPVSK